MPYKASMTSFERDRFSNKVKNVVSLQSSIQVVFNQRYFLNKPLVLTTSLCCPSVLEIVASLGMGWKKYTFWRAREVSLG